MKGIKSSFLMLVVVLFVCMTVLSCQSKQIHLEANTAKKAPSDRIKLLSQTSTPKQIWGQGPGILHLSSVDDIVKDERYVSIPKLPVLKRHLITDITGLAQNGLSEKELQTKMEGYVNLLKIKEVTYRSWKEKNLDNKVNMIDAESGNIRINVNADGRSYLSFNHKKKSSPYKTKDEFLKVMKDTLEQYQYLIPLKNPTIKAGCNTSYDGELGCSSSIFEKDNDVRQEFINQYVEAYWISQDVSENYTYDFINLEEYRVELSKDFELIGQDKAKNLLLNGDYYSNVGDVGSIDEKKIAKVTLEYRTLSPSGRHVYPFYVFYIETSVMDTLITPNAKPYQLCYVNALSYDDLAAFQDKDGNLQ